MPMSVNYLIEINGLDDWELTHPIPATAYKLMRKLQYLANKERFPERITVSNGLLMSMIGCSEDSLIKARNWLIQAGLIAYKGQKKLTPVYTLRYFSQNPVYNSKLQSYEQGIKQGNEQGNGQGIERGNGQGTYINKTMDNETYGNLRRSDEDTATTTYASQEDEPMGSSLLHYQSYTNKGLLVQERVRELNVDDRRIAEVFPPRARPMTRQESRELMSIRAYLEASPEAGELFFDRRKVLDTVLASSRFPMELVAEAISMTVSRNGKYALDNPMAYMLKLLFDWEERGIATVAALRDSKDDWWDRGYTEGSM